LVLHWYYIIMEAYGDNYDSEGNPQDIESQKICKQKNIGTELVFQHDFYNPSLY